MIEIIIILETVMIEIIIILETVMIEIIIIPGIIGVFVEETDLMCLEEIKKNIQILRLVNLKK